MSRTQGKDDPKAEKAKDGDRHLGEQ